VLWYTFHISKYVVERTEVIGKWRKLYGCEAWCSCKFCREFI